jgi:PAS domain S-box-containing protein
MGPLGSGDIAWLGFEQAARNAPVAITVIDGSGQVIDSNERARELTRRQLGREMPADLDGAIDIFHPDGRRYRREEWPAIRSFSSGEEVVDEEFFYALPEDARLWIRCSSSPVRGERGEIVAAVLAMTDVTEQKRQEQRLTHLAGLLDNTEDAVVALDERYVITVWNDGAQRLYGWRADEVLGRHADEVARTNLSESERTELRRELAVSGRWRGEVTVARKDGTTVEAELISVALRGPSRDITGYLTIHRDISERRRAEEALRAARERSETILESITDAFVAVDRDWRYTYVNDRALSRMRDRRGTALVREDVIGRNMWELFPEAIGTEVQRQYERAMREDRAVAFETYFAYTGHWIEAHAYPSESGLAIYYRDVSARRRVEEALRDAREQRAQADRRLEHVREAERSRIARELHDEALQGLTHALAITGRHGRSRDDEVSAILQQVGRQLRTAIYGLHLERDDEHHFSEALGRLVELNREMAPSCEVTLELDDDLPRGPFGGRGTDVLRIVGEALSNACRHAAADRTVVRVTASGTQLSVEVTDDGRGFDARRGSPSLRGQGLRGMRERAELLDADLEIRSDRTGTTVRLHVALAAGPAGGPAGDPPQRAGS